LREVARRFCFTCAFLTLLCAFLALAGSLATGFASVRSWIFGTSVLVGSSERYVPATASGANRSTARIAYFTGLIVAQVCERTIK
jgi:hypothetical protein